MTRSYVPLSLRRVAALAAAIAFLGGCGGDEDAEPRLIAAVGDSITAGAPGWDPDPGRRALLSAHDPESQWEHWAAVELGDDYEFRNCGVPGERTDEIAARLDACIDGADVVVLQGGVNDLAQRHTPASAARNLRAMVERVREQGLPLLVANVLPVNRDYRNIRPAIRRLNRMIDALARDQDVDVVDFFSTLEDDAAGDRLRPQWTADGVHPSVEGYRRLGRLVANACSTNGQCDPVSP
jgi:lysophospholipase L1-like esterase